MRRSAANAQALKIDDSIPESKALSRMTPAAVLKIKITAESSPAVMAGGAGVVTAGKVHQRARRADLPLLR